MQTPKLPDPERVAACLKETADIEILPRFRALAATDVMEKGPGDPVTVADIAAERRLGEMLPALLPGSVVVAEEAVHHQPALLGLLKEERPVWLVDPVGGTKTFAAGEPGFGTYVSLLWRGETLAGWILDPVAGETTFAVRGEGAWTDGVRHRIENAGKLDSMRCYIHPRVYEREGETRVRAKHTAFAEVVPLGSVGSAFRALAKGTVQAAVFSSTWPWDHAPGVLIHYEAGGFVARRDGVAYDATERLAGLLATPDRESWERVRGLLEAD